MQESFITGSDGVKLRVVEAGPGSGSRAALVFVPGWGMTAEIWNRQFDYFSKAHRVISFDPRGQGASDKPESGYATSRRAQDIAEILESLSVQNAILAGWSLGALEVLDLAWHDTSRLRALVLIDNSVDRGYANGLATGGRLLKSVERLPYPQAIGDFVRSMFQKPLPDAELELLTQSALKMPRAVALELLRSASSGEGLSRVLKHKIWPVYFAVTPRFKAEAINLQKDFPAVLFEVYEDAGHALFIDDADRFNHALEAFIQGLS